MDSHKPNCTSACVLPQVKLMGEPVGHVAARNSFLVCYKPTTSSEHSTLLLAAAVAQELQPRGSPLQAAKE